MEQKQNKIVMLVIGFFLIIFTQSLIVRAEPEEHSLVYTGSDYSVKILFSEKAEIPDTAYLNVTEIMEGTKEYEQYLDKTEAFMNKEEDAGVSSARFYDICIMDDGKELEPKDSVKVLFHCEEGVQKTESEEISVIHFVEDGSRELLEVEEEKYENQQITDISFNQESFSVIGMIVFDKEETNVKEAESKVITETDRIIVKKDWSDGKDVHKNDSVTVGLYERGTDNAWGRKSEAILNSGNGWNKEFTNLDKTKSYTIKEEKVISGNKDITATYKSVITNETVRKWCKVSTNQLSNGQRILLIYDDGKKRLLRKSETYDELNLRTLSVETAKDATYGEYCKTSVGTHCVWVVEWNEAEKAWNLFNDNGDSYLTLVHNESTGAFEWTTSRELVEGSHLTYANGMFSAIVGNEKRYLGNISGNGPYAGVKEGDSGVTKFQIFSYKNFSPVISNIFNEKNETAKEHETNVDVIAKKTIDYLGDGKDNPDTDADNGVLPANVLKDLYRLDLSVKMQTDVTGLDLLLVIDVSSSMIDNTDAKDTSGNNITRAEALRQALNTFIPEFLPENTKNRMAVVAFESESIVLQKWTDDSKSILEKINSETNGAMPLYKGQGTNYEAALARAHEAMTMRGYSNNAQAMIFLSDGEPTVYIKGNDETEPGNITYNMGEASLSGKGIECVYPFDLNAVWGNTDGKALASANEAITSFRKHHPEIMTGTIAFNTWVSAPLRNLATGSEFVTRIENGSPADLIRAMKLITEYTPKNIVITDIFTENIDFYEEYPDVKVMECDENGNKQVLFSTKNGLSAEGRQVLNNEKTVAVDQQKIELRFHENYKVKNNYTYYFSFNVNASQSAMNKYADSKGNYTEQGEKDTDYAGNTTSSLKEGFYSNGEDSQVSYQLNGVQMKKKYSKPVIQVREGTMTLIKTDISGNAISTGAYFELYRKAEDNTGVSVEGLDGAFVKVGEGVTDEEGKIQFDHLRLSVFDCGYPYYLVEKTPPEGYVQLESPLEIKVFDRRIEVANSEKWISVDEEGNLIVKNGTYTDFSFIKTNERKDTLKGAEFELSRLMCENSKHSHEEDCFEYLVTKTSTPKVDFENLITEETYQLREIKAPDGYLCPKGYWLIRTDKDGKVQIQGVNNPPEFEQNEEGIYVLVNEEVLEIPLTGGNGITGYLMIGIVLITGGYIYEKKKKNFYHI